MGKVVNLAVAEGDVVKQGQLLLQIDPRNLETTVQNREASLATARSQLDQTTRADRERARWRSSRPRTRLRRQEDMCKAGLLPREQLRARAERRQDARRPTCSSASSRCARRNSASSRKKPTSSSAQYDLNKVRIVSPIDGLVTRRNIEEGETAVIGTMNNAGTVLLTIADMSVIETEIEVDETDIPFITDRPAGEGHDRRDSRTRRSPARSPRSATARFRPPARPPTGRATNFKVVVHDRRRRCPNVRPGFTCTADITTATRQKAVGVPIQAMTVRELVVDAAGQDRASAERRPGQHGVDRPCAAPAELKPGQTRKEIEGVFVVQGRQARCSCRSRPASPARSTSRSSSGLKEGDEVITGPFASVRSLKEGDAVKVDDAGTPTPDHDRQLMHQFLEAAAIALQAIWANKLRSLLTVIGNVVAVTSIIAVVSLVQGLNASVEDAIQSRVRRRRVLRPAARPDADRRRGPARAQSNPRVTLDDADAIRTFGAQHRLRHGGGRQLGARSSTAASRSTASASAA